MSDKLITFETDAETGLTIERELLADEALAWQELHDTAKKEAEAKEKAKSSAVSKLAKLGLTAEEIAAL